MSYVHLRRALILFAVVLGVAALAASVVEPRRPAPDVVAPPSVGSGTAPDAGGSAASPDAATLSFDASEPRTHTAGDRQALTILVSVPAPGLVEIPELGLIAQGDPLTPARFELLAKDPGSYAITFSRGAGQTPAAAGTLVVP